MTTATASQIDALLAQAESLRSAESLALSMGDDDAADRLDDEIDSLLRKARRLDPRRERPAWSAWHQWSDA